MNNFRAIISVSTDWFWEKKSTGDSALFIYMNCDLFDVFIN